MAAINFSNALGIHPSAMLLRATRAEILANNLANADTPGYKSRDINFQAMLAGEVASQQSLGMNRTQQGHLSGRRKADDDILYRNPIQPSIDGNTVDSQIEQAIYSRNALSYNSSFEFLSSKFKGMKGAIRGE
ncbi:flagellar basal body rod protein FlgB [Thalassolituus sp. LLYu03]|uniref:flagellar basal body rod protein FlgB n=1 Tax=Thalassolituus sp. LLYu03 TaxID=3421656 RepID=UPI003D2BC35B